MQRSSGILMCGSVDVILAMEIYAMSHAKSMPSLESQQRPSYEIYETLNSLLIFLLIRSFFV